MTDLQTWVAPTLDRLASSLVTAGPSAWDQPSLCEGWQVRHVVAHMTMPARLTPDDFGAEMAAARGDFTAMSNAVALRDGALPVDELLDQLRSPALAAWQPPGGGAAGALAHAVIHASDITVPLGLPGAAPIEAAVAVLDAVTESGGSWFGVDLSGTRLEATDADWDWGSGALVRADAASLAALLGGRTLPDGVSLPAAS